MKPSTIIPVAVFSLLLPFSKEAFGSSWKGEYFSSKDLTGKPVLTRDEGEGPLDFTLATNWPPDKVGNQSFSARWTGSVLSEGGIFTFMVSSDDGCRLYIDGEPAIDDWNDHGETLDTASLFLKPGSHKVVAEYYQAGGGAVFRLSWTQKPVKQSELIAVSGTVRVPNGLNIPENGARVQVRALNDYKENFYTWVDLSQRDDKARYTILVPPYPSIVNYRISYFCRLGGVMEKGYYNQAGTTGDGGGGSFVGVRDKPAGGLDLSLLRAVTISGKVGFPGGRKAPKNGVWIWILAPSNKSGLNGYSPYNKWFRIEEGRTSAPYSLQLPLEADFQLCRVRYYSSGAGYARTGYYSPDGTLANSDYAKSPLFDLSEGDRTGIDLTLIPDVSVVEESEENKLAMDRAADIVSNIVGGDYTAFEKELALHDYLLTNSFYGWYDTCSSVYTMLFHGTGECGAHSRTMFALLSNAGVDVKMVYGTGHVWNMVRLGGDWYYLDSTFDDVGTNGVKYNCFNITAEQNRMTGHSWPVNDYPACTKLFPFSESDYVHRKELSSRDYRRIIGAIRLPDGETAPPGGFGVTVNGNWLPVPEGANSVFFMVAEPLRGTNKTCVLDVWLDASAPYVQHVYYSKKGAVTAYDKADAIDLTGLDVSGIDITLVKGPSVSGTISLPGGAAAGPEGIQVWVNLVDANGASLYWPRFLIPAGSNSAAYTVRIPDNEIEKNYRVRFDVGSSDYVNRLYYIKGGLTPELSSAFVPDWKGGGSKGLDVTLERGTLLSGTISLPGGMTAGGNGVNIWANALHTNGQSFLWPQFTIPAGGSSVAYSIRVPDLYKNQPCKIRFDTDSPLFMKSSFYGKKYTAYYLWDCTTLKPSSGDQTGLNAVLLKGVLLSGTICLPGNDLAPEGGLRTWIYVYDTNNQCICWPDFTVPAGKNSTGFQVRVPGSRNGARYCVAYGGGGGIYCLWGVYSNGTTVHLLNNASPLSVTDKDIGGIRMYLHRGQKVSGTFTLPEGVTAPEGGLNVSLKYYYHLSNGSYWCTWQGYSISAGANSVPFSGCFWVDETVTGIRLGYYCDFPSVVREAYYTGKGPVTNYNDGLLLKPDKEGLNGLDFRLLAK